MTEPVRAGPSVSPSAALATAYVIAVAAIVGCRDSEISRFSGVSAAHPEAAAKITTSPLSDPLPPHRELTVVECPVAALVSAESDLDEAVARLIEAANTQLDGAQAAAAWTCADRAADLAPQSVEAHHLRGAALAALGRWTEAQLAFGLALSLDPDDPETLRGAAHFYVNEMERSQDTLRLGLSLAERGSARAIARRRRNPELIADLALLEAQALSDLGHSDEALGRLEVALRQAPDRADALHERGVARFNLGLFAQAKPDFLAVLKQRPDDAFAHHMLGLTLDWLGEGEAEAHLRQAVELSPGEFTPAVPLAADELRAEIDQVIASLPAERRAELRVARFEVSDLPTLEDLRSVSPPFPPTILGLYRGPLDANAPDAVRAETPSIVLYRKNLARAVRTRAELSREIRDTVLHEIGHLEGLDEDDLRRRGME
jgi:Flp pilus assembly protein TadD/predicted Zn-dependent protease with MMP-like domain